LAANNFSRPEIANKRYTAHFGFGNRGKILPPSKLPIRNRKRGNEKEYYSGWIPQFWLDSLLNLPFLFFAVETLNLPLEYLLLLASMLRYSAKLAKTIGSSAYGSSEY